MFKKVSKSNQTKIIISKFDQYTYEELCARE